MLAPQKAKRFVGRTLVVVALGCVIWFYHWSVRSSGGFELPGPEDYYNFLVRGWRTGHLYMTIEPSAAMRALSDPYDPAQNGSVRLGDASYFKGHYYLYFGAAPAALLMLPYHFFTGRELGTTSSIFIFCVIGFLAASGVWLAIRRKYFPESAFWVGPVGVIMIGFASHIFALQRRPLVWELPISAGFAFTMLALLAIYISLHGRWPALALGLGALSLGLATASRPTCLLGAVMFIAPLLHFWRAAPGTSQWKRGVAAIMVGLGICLGAICAHNFARFGNPFEFGQNYQLSGVYESKVHHFRASYLLHNFGIYYFHWPDWTDGFPFISATAVHGGPEGYLGGWNEPICGVLVTLPILWLALALPLAWRTRPPAEAAPLRAMLMAVASFYTVMAVTILAYFVATPRYLADFTPSLCLLAMLGLLGVERWAQSARWNKAVPPVLAVLCLVTFVSGVLMSFDHLGRLTRPRWANVEHYVNSIVGRKNSD